MDVLTLEQVTTVDERLRLFTFPEDFAGGRSFPEAAAKANQERIAHADIAANVPEAVRGYYELARKLHIYGCFEYEFFTLAAERTHFALEFALKARFLDEYSGTVPLRNHQTGDEEDVAVRSYRELEHAFRGKGRLKRYSHWKGWRLEGHPNFDASLSSLFGWARVAGLVPDALSPIWDEATNALRNFAAHPEGRRVIMPLNSAQYIHDAAEFINRLWGHETPGGRLFYEPMTALICVCRENGGESAQAEDATLLAGAPWVGCHGDWWIVEAANDSHALDWAIGLRGGIAGNMGVKVHAGPATRHEAVAAVDELLRSGWQARPVRDLLP